MSAPDGLAAQVMQAWQAYQALCLQAACDESLMLNPFHEALRDIAYQRFSRVFQQWVRP